MASVAIYMPTTLTFIIKFSCVYRGPEPYILRYPISEGSSHSADLLSGSPGLWGGPGPLRGTAGRSQRLPLFYVCLTVTMSGGCHFRGVSYLFTPLHLHCLHLTQPQVSHSDTHSSSQVVYMRTLRAASPLLSSHSRHSDTSPKMKPIILCRILFATIQWLPTVLSTKADSAWLVPRLCTVSSCSGFPLILCISSTLSFLLSIPQKCLFISLVLCTYCFIFNHGQYYTQTLNSHISSYFKGEMVAFQTAFH